MKNNKYKLNKKEIKQGNYQQINLDIEDTMTLKGIAIMLVLIGHIAKLNSVMPYNMRFAGAWGVCIFLICSGFGVTKSQISKGCSFITYKKRITKVWFPYFLVTMVLIIIDSILFSKTYSFESNLFSLLGLNVNLEVDSTMWFITFILVWYTVYYLIFSRIKNNRIGLMMLFVFSILLRLLKNLDILSEMYTLYAPYIFDFPIGVAFALFINKFKKDDRNSIFCILLYILIFIVAYNRIQVSSLYYIIADYSFAFLAINVVLLFKNKNIIKKILMFLGNISFEIYLLEGSLLFKYNMLSISENLVISISIYLVILLSLSIILNKLIKNIHTAKKL